MAMSEQDRTAMQKALVPFSDDMDQGFQDGWTAALEYRDSRRCEYDGVEL